MDVRAKQRLCLGVVRQTLTGLVAVSPHVISTVRRFVLAKTNRLRRSRFFETDKIVFPVVVALKSCRASRRESGFLNFNELRRQTGAAKVARETKSCRSGKFSRSAF